jgi:hypothetical protein
MSNLHLLLDEANKHDPKGFIPAVNNTFPWKDELGLSTYREQMELPKAINFVDGTVAAPTTVDGDVYVLTGSGVIDSSWGNATFGDWVRFTNTIATEITPLAGYLCYDVTAASWMEFDGAVWAVFGGGGGVVSTIFTGGTMASPSTIVMAGNGLTFDGGQTTLKGSGSTDSTTAVLVQNLLGADLLEVKDGGSTTIYGNLTQTKATLVNSLTSSASNTFGEHNFISDNGTKGFIYWGGSTYAGGSNTALINNSFCIGSRATADNFVLTANSGGILFTLGGFMNDANTRVKISTLGTVITLGSAASTVAQETLHLNGRFYMLNTSVPSTPTSGGVTYVEGGSLKFKGSSGTVTVLAPA